VTEPPPPNEPDSREFALRVSTMFGVALPAVLASEVAAKSVLPLAMVSTSMRTWHTLLRRFT
jgi:hypothetical protein